MCRRAGSGRTSDAAAKRVLGRSTGHIGDTPWMEAALPGAAGIETVVIGPTGAGAHADVDGVDLASVERLAEILVESALEYCQ